MQGAVVGSLRRDAGGLATLHRNLGVLHTQGYAVSWGSLLADVAGAVVALPTYAFQRQRYWLEPARSLADVAAAGLSPSPHPLLGAATTLAEHDGVLFTTRLSLADHPWLADHTVFGNVLVPGTLLLELALAAGQAIGCHTVGELTLAVPLALPPQGAARLQISVRTPDDAGARAFALYGRDDAAGDEAAWTCHATGSLVSHERGADAGGSAAVLDEWPPAGAVPVDITELYPKLASQGLGYGPAFRGLTEAWRDERGLYGRAVLPDRIAATAGDYGIHPALLDAALHLLAAGSIAASGSETAQGGAQVLLPFAWSDVTLQATGASELRVRMMLPDTSPMLSAARRWICSMCTSGGSRGSASSVSIGRRLSRCGRHRSRWLAISTVSIGRPWSWAMERFGAHSGRCWGPGVLRRRSGSRLTRRCRRFVLRSMGERRSRSG